MVDLQTFERQRSPTDSPWPLSDRLRLLVWHFAWPVLCRWTPKPFNRWRLLVLRIFGTIIDGTPFVHQSARIQIPWHLTIRRGASIGDRANLYSLGEIEIGTDAVIAQEAYLCTGTHAFDRQSMNLMVAPIVVGAEAFVAARAFIMPGARIGTRAIVGACSVVTRDVPDNAIVAGSPALIIGERPAPVH
jgi:putative colanic acid biosynthesis acetyltransferase WcaF